MTKAQSKPRKKKEPITPAIEAEIQNLCHAGVRGQYVDMRRVTYLYRKYPKDWERIAAPTKAEAIEEIKNTFSGMAKGGK